MKRQSVLNGLPAIRQAVLYARVSSREQEAEGYSLAAQVKLLRDYAAPHGIHKEEAPKTSWCMLERARTNRCSRLHSPGSTIGTSRSRSPFLHVQEVLALPHNQVVGAEPHQLTKGCYESEQQSTQLLRKC
jgi:hypothetical protein